MLQIVNCQYDTSIGERTYIKNPRCRLDIRPYFLDSRWRLPKVNLIAKSCTGTRAATVDVLSKPVRGGVFSLPRAFALSGRGIKKKKRKKEKLYVRSWNRNCSPATPVYLSIIEKHVKMASRGFRFADKIPRRIDVIRFCSHANDHTK